VTAFKTAKVGKRVAVKVGEKLPVAGVTLIVRGARKEFDHGIDASKGRKNPACSGAKPKEEDKSDNANSVVLSLEYKGWKFFDGGDLTWNMEEKLACPTTVLPEVDVFQSTHHGLDLSNNPVLVRALHPKVAVFNNGPKKGCMPEPFATVKAIPGHRGRLPDAQEPGGARRQHHAREDRQPRREVRRQLPQAVGRAERQEVHGLQPVDQAREDVHDQGVVSFRDPAPRRDGASGRRRRPGPGSRRS
jgi:hypothetical protein